ncbi:hypothetical protein A7P53_03060 [Acinetobacter defluvii]|uniref:zinc-ribbon and DUF3426 domain-containing protein n=1 Tax=Acinetobacter defluvii TaxID=1871111 RepID=UPI00149071CA|nr:zinc-ribbon and DUF3426 domain-containing protein [Acinetobacter defluvii]NNP71437.1 hypothetical protein [Acinetobacter defluvii]
MSDKQTRCPNCLTLYKVSVMQLTIAEGMVCCPKCSTEFNALLNLVQISINLDQDPPLTAKDAQVSFNQLPTGDLSQFNIGHEAITEFFNRKIQNSNIDLRTYLNTLKFVEDSALNVFPSLHLATHHNHKSHQHLQKTRLYYVMWTLINIALVSILSFQILWFNPNLLDRYPILNSIFTQTCSVLRCETIDQRYKQIQIKNLQVKALNNQETEFSGQLLNQFSKSLELPLIKATVYKENTKIKTFIVSPQDYLVNSLAGIKRIPQNSPYAFKFELSIQKNSIDSWKLEIIHP